MIPESERIFVSCDVSNLWRSCREKFGDSARLDFQILSGVLRALRHPRAVKQQLMAYIVARQKQNQHMFVDTLQSFGFTVRERYMSYRKDLDPCPSCRQRISRPLHSDWDVGITIDALARIDEYDTFALMSGDGDFGQLLMHLRERGKHTLVMSFEHALSRHLTETADEVIPLTEAVIFRQQEA